MSWFTIARLGLAQMMLGSMVVIATSTLNRVMVVELALPAIVPGALVGLHYALQVLRPRWGFAAEVGGSGWIVGGMAMLAGGVVMAAAAAGVIGGGAQAGGLALAIAAYALIGLGVGGMGTALLTVLARGVGAARRPAAATCVWLMMIAGSAVTAGVVSQLLVPFSFARLLRVTAGAAAIALAVTAIATPRLRAATGIRKALLPAERFGTALRTVWADAGTRQFAAFVFLSMLAYSAQELILEPFAGLVFGLGPAATAGLIGLQHGGVLAGMLLVALGGSTLARRAGGMRVWTVGGCGASAVALLALAGCGVSGQAALLRPCLLALGVSNGVFAVAAIGAMMQVSAGQTRAGGTGTSMGLFGAAQAVAFGLGGLLSSGASDAARHLLGSPVAAYACVFAAQAGLFAAAAALATRIFAAPVARAARTDGWSRAA